MALEDVNQMSEAGKAEKAERTEVVEIVAKGTESAQVAESYLGASQYKAKEGAHQA